MKEFIKNINLNRELVFESDLEVEEITNFFEDLINENANKAIIEIRNEL